MRKITKNLLRVLGVITVLVFTAVGVSAYNYHHYKRRGPDPRDSSVVAARGGVTPVSGTYMRGFYYPAHGAAHPGTVVVFKGSDGSNNDELARQVRDQGYNVLGLYFFGQPGQQQYLANVPLEFFDEVLAWINDHGDVQEPITVMGVSKGAELVANLAIRYPEIDNIVLYTPTAHNYQGMNYQWEPSPSFAWRGEPVDYVRLRFLPSSMVRSVMNLPVSYRKTSEQALAEATNLEAASIPIEQFSGHGLLFAGDQDAMWPADTAVRELSDRNKNLEGVVYHGAGHLFDEDITHYGPIWPTMFGGSIEGNRIAKTQSDALLFQRLQTWHS